MKILLEVNPLLHRQRTGIPTYLDSLVRALLEQGADEEFTLWAPDLERDPLPELAGKRPHARFRGRGLYSRAFLEQAWQRGARVEAVTGDFDVYHLPFHGWPAPRRSKQTRSVVTILDLGFAHYPETATDALGAGHLRYLVACAARQAEEADRVIAISESTARDVRQMLDVPAERIDVVPLATDLRPPERDDPEIDALLAKAGVPERYLLHVGTWEPRKNVEALVRAVHRLRRKLEERDVYLCATARGAWPRVERLIDELGVGDRVRRLDYLPRECLPALYARSLGFVFPSLQEGFGLPVLEAMVCGSPVIAADASSLPEVAGDAALLVDPTDDETLAAAIERLLDEPDLRSELVRRGHAQAARFSWDGTARRTLEIYRKAVDECARR